MMNIIPKLVLAPLFFSVFMISSTYTYADDQSPSDKPPQVINLDDDESTASTVTHRKKEVEQQVMQTIHHGEQTEVNVTNEIGTYIVKPDQTIGTSVPGDTQSSSNHAAQWVVKSWGGTHGTDPGAVPPTLPENPDIQTNQD
jgi:hypothetical protein